MAHKCGDVVSSQKIPCSAFKGEEKIFLITKKGCIVCAFPACSTGLCKEIRHKE